MENCEYTEIFTEKGDAIKGRGKNNWIPILRQCFVSSGILCVYILQGLFLGLPTVLVAQTRKEANSTEIVSDEMLSWITTMPVLSSLPFVIILPLLFNRIGRKLTFLFVWLLQLIGFTIFYNSSNLYHVLIGEIFAGASSASTFTIWPVIIAEYTSPKYRGVFLALKGATAFWGIWIANAVGTFFYWKNVTVVAFGCSVYIISVLAWPESPYWLARKGRYEECAKSHRWLKGVNEDSEKELAQLIISQKCLANDYKDECTLRRIRSIITLRPFYKPVVIIALLFAQYNCTGKLVISLYAIEVLKNLTPDESFVVNTMLILDGVTVFSMYVGCIILRYFKRRTLLLLFSCIGISVLYILSFYTYLAFLSVIEMNNFVILLLLTVFSIAISCGPLIMCTSLYGEIIPPRYLNIALFFAGGAGVVSTASLIKMSPFLFRHFKMHGSFLFFAISSTIFLIIIYIHLPETKDKTIQEIEELFQPVSRKPKMLVKDNKTIPKDDVELNNFIYYNG